MTIKFNNFNFQKLELSMPSQGVWVAFAEIFGLNSPSEGDEGTLTADSIELVGTVVAKNIVGPQKTIITIVGGKGNLSTLSTEPKNFNEKSADIILREIVEDEEQFDSFPSQFSSFVFKQWQTFANIPRGHQLTRVVSLFDNFKWSINKQGLIQITNVEDKEIELPTSWGIIDKTFDGTTHFQSTKIDKFITPGKKYKGKTIEEVKYCFTKNKTTFKLITISNSNKLREILNQDFREKSLSVYEAQIIEQNSDGPGGTKVGGTLNVLPVDSTIRGGGLSKVPIEVGHGVFLQVNKDTKCNILFKEGDPDKPVVCGFGQMNEGPGGQFIWVFGDINSAQWLALSNLCNDNFDELKQKIDDLVSDFNAHTHPAPTGPTSTPTTPSTVSPSVVDVECNRVKST